MAIFPNLFLKEEMSLLFIAIFPQRTCFHFCSAVFWHYYTAKQQKNSSKLLARNNEIYFFVSSIRSFVSLFLCFDSQFCCFVSLFSNVQIFLEYPRIALAGTCQNVSMPAQAYCYRRKKMLT